MKYPAKKYLVELENVQTASVTKHPNDKNLTPDFIETNDGIT